MPKVFRKVSALAGSEFQHLLPRVSSAGPLHVQPRLRQEPPGIPRRLLCTAPCSPLPFLANSSDRSSLEPQSLPPQLSKLTAPPRRAVTGKPPQEERLSWGSPWTPLVRFPFPPGWQFSTACCSGPEDSCHVFYPDILFSAAQHQLPSPSQHWKCA